MVVVSGYLVDLSVLRHDHSDMQPAPLVHDAIGLALVRAARRLSLCRHDALDERGD